MLAFVVAGVILGVLARVAQPADDTSLVATLLVGVVGAVGRGG